MTHACVCKPTPTNAAEKGCERECVVQDRCVTQWDVAERETRFKHEVSAVVACVAYSTNGRWTRIVCVVCQMRCCTLFSEYQVFFEDLCWR
eukprot:3864690-Amphidinium_carterae.1